MNDCGEQQRSGRRPVRRAHDRRSGATYSSMTDRVSTEELAQAKKPCRLPTKSVQKPPAELTG